MELVDGVFPECIMSYFKWKYYIQFCFSSVETLSQMSRVKATPVPKSLNPKCERRKRMQVAEEMAKQRKSVRRKVFSILQILYQILHQYQDE